MGRRNKKDFVVTVFTRYEEYHRFKDVYCYGERIAQQLNCDYSIIGDNSLYRNKLGLGQFKLKVLIELIRFRPSYVILFGLRYYNVPYSIFASILFGSSVIIKSDTGAFSVYNSQVFKGLKGHFTLLYFKFLFRGKISCETNDLRNALIRKYGFNPIRLVTNYNKASLPILSVLKKENIILWVGDWKDPNKNFSLLLNSLNLSLSNENSWTIIVVGGKKSSPLCIGNYSIQFLGQVNDRLHVAKLFSRSRVLSLTSFNEGSPLVFSEAMLYNLRILSTPVNSAHEYCSLSDGEMCTTFEPEEYAKALNIILDKKDTGAMSVDLKWSWRHSEVKI